MTSKSKHVPAVHRARRPYFNKAWTFTATRDIPKYDIKAGDDFPALKFSVIRMYWNQRKVGPKGHAWTIQAIQSFKDGKPIREYSTHEKFEDAVYWRARRKPILEEPEVPETDLTVAEIKEIFVKELNEMTKKELAKYAAENFTVVIDPEDHKKDEMIEKIMEINFADLEDAE